MSLRLVNLIADTSFGANSFERYINNLADYDGSTKRITREPLKEDGFCGVLVRGGYAEQVDSSILYVKDVTVAFRKHVEVFIKDDITFHLDGRRSIDTCFSTFVYRGYLDLSRRSEKEEDQLP